MQTIPPRHAPGALAYVDAGRADDSNGRLTARTHQRVGHCGKGRHDGDKQFGRGSHSRRIHCLDLKGHHADGLYAVQCAARTGRSNALPGPFARRRSVGQKAPGPVQPNSRSDVRPVRDPWNMRREQAPPASWPAVGGITASLESLWIKARACGRLAAPRIWWIVRGFRANRRLRHACGRVSNGCC